MNSLSVLIEKQRAFYKTNQTLSVTYRVQYLKKLKEIILKYEKEILEALYNDLNKSETEAYLCEFGLVLSEISYMCKHIYQFAKEKTVRTPFSESFSRSYQKKCPYGNVLVMSPWNYPFLLSMVPLIEALAAGNTVILKPSAYSPNTSKMIQIVIKECFEEDYVACVLGGRKENEDLLNQKFDLIFFTGSQEVGKLVMRKAANYLTPVVLELGGKSPCIVDESADVPLAAKRIVFGKFINCGQTCIAPDYILCHKDVKAELIESLKQQIVLQYSKKENYGKIINHKHFDRLMGLIDEKKVIYGGFSNKDDLYISPTILDEVDWQDAVMQEEIFGPILPILTFENIEEVIDCLSYKEKPLALYYFTKNKQRIKKVTSEIRYGGGCINDCIIHIHSFNLGFGGVGESGMGAYHGKIGFDTFSHTKSIVDKKTWIDLPMRYPQFQKKYFKLIKWFLK